MKKLFDFDVTLKDLMHLGERAKEVTRLGAVFSLLKIFWYNLKDRDKEAEAKRWNRIRVGSIYVFLDDDNHLHIDFVTRFNLTAATAYIDALELISRIDPDKMPDYLKDYERKDE